MTFEPRLPSLAPFGWKGLAPLVLLVLVIFLAFNSFFTIDQAELGNVRRFGTVLYPRDQPLRPGIHFKMPFIDQADRIRVSLQTILIPVFDVLTIDNQRVSIEENFNYTIPPEQAYHLLYEVGRSGNFDVESQVIPVAHDRTARIFAGQNMVSVNANREVIQEQINKSISSAVEGLFGIASHSFQISAIRPSENFMKSIDQATMAKNAAIAAENQLRTKEFEAKQVAATAKGQADASIEQARGQAESTRLNAEANKLKLVLEGEGLKASLDNQIAALGGADKYLQYLTAKAAQNWNGQTPQIMSGGGSGSAPNLIIPLSGLK